MIVQPVEVMIFNSYSTERYKNILRHETELKWIKLLQTPFLLGFNDNIYHEENISKMPDFDVFSLLDIRKRNRKSHGKRKKGNLKRKHKNKTFWTLVDLCKILKSGRRQMLSKLSSLSIAHLRILDEEANKFYDRKHNFYQTALLTRCYTQHALRSYIDWEMIHIRQFIKIPFINKGIDFTDLPSIFRDNTVESSITDCFENKEPPVICYKPIRSTLFNFNKLVADLDIDTKTPDS